MTKPSTEPISPFHNLTNLIISGVLFNLIKIGLHRFADRKANIMIIAKHGPKFSNVHAGAELCNMVFKYRYIDVHLQFYNHGRELLASMRN